MDITMKLPEWIGVLAVICGGVYFIARLIYNRKIENLETREAELVKDLDNKSSEIIRLRTKNGKLETDVQVWQGEAKRGEERFDLHEKEQKETISKLKEEHAAQIQEFENKMDILLRGEKGTSRIVEWDNLCQIRYTNYLNTPIHFTKDWVKFRGDSPPLEVYERKLEGTIKPEDGLTFERIQTEKSNIRRWANEKGYLSKQKGKIVIWDLPGHYQVIVKVLNDITLDAKLQMISPHLPQPHDQHQTTIYVKPDDYYFRVLRAGKWA